MNLIVDQILKNALIYLDNILFSKEKPNHIKLLHQFYGLHTQYGVMPFESKMVLTIQKIDFLRHED